VTGISWTLSPRETYNYTVEFTDGTSQFFFRVERPQLYFAEPEQGVGPYDRPTLLWNGVCENFGCLDLLGQKAGPTFTLARPLGPAV